MDPTGLKIEAPPYVPPAPKQGPCCAAEYAIFVNVTASGYQACVDAIDAWHSACDAVNQPNPYGGEIGAAHGMFAQKECEQARARSKKICDQTKAESWGAYYDYQECLKKPCQLLKQATLL